jgi:hypothetical protein
MVISACLTSDILGVYAGAVFILIGLATVGWSIIARNRPL